MFLEFTSRHLEIVSIMQTSTYHNQSWYKCPSADDHTETPVAVDVVDAAAAQNDLRRCLERKREQDWCLLHPLFDVELCCKDWLSCLRDKSMALVTEEEPLVVAAAVVVVVMRTGPLSIKE